MIENIVKLVVLGIVGKFIFEAGRHDQAVDPRPTKATIINEMVDVWKQTYKPTEEIKEDTSVS
jgi:hypothetical protein